MSAPEPTSSAIIALAKLAWDIIKSTGKWFLGLLRGRPSQGFVVPRKTLIAMAAPLAEHSWWRATKVDDRDGMEINCRLQITNVAECGIKISAITLVRPRCKVHQQSFGMQGKAIIPRHSIGMLHYSAWVHPRLQAVGEPIVVNLYLFDQFNNRHKAKGLMLKGVG